MSKASLVPENSKHQPKASAKITDVCNGAQLQVKSHQDAHDRAITEAENISLTLSTTETPTTALHSGSRATKWKTVIVDSDDDENEANGTSFYLLPPRCSQRNDFSLSIKEISPTLSNHIRCRKRS